MFGKVLKEIRLKNGDSLKALGEKSEVSFSYIDRIERGEKSVSDKIFEKLLEIYPLDRNKLIKAYIESQLPQTIKQLLEQPKGKDDLIESLVPLLENLDKENRKIIFNTLIEKLEYISLKSGKYEEVKEELAEVKEKTDKL